MVRWTERGNGTRNSPDTREEPRLAVRLLTLREVADLLHAHPNSIRRWSDAGLLPVVRIGRRGDRRFRISDLEEFLEGRAEGTVSRARR